MSLALEDEERYRTPRAARLSTIRPAWSGRQMKSSAPYSITTGPVCTLARAQDGCK
ncbi:hypothetical protein PUR59_01800 [Streptomyces sp. SP18ES09]|uniref:hypothetical protein n=1 Tax=Streptomyces sp. SP18ES09 TaxID=3002532 RepID=UPI002E7829C1|nr:hypothetical protein [Streptomyces sp. SP18ES09]MEE1813774.1 hypothetical protein [Streptomyces sp. SP18ES09]